MEELVRKPFLECKGEGFTCKSRTKDIQDPSNSPVLSWQGQEMKTGTRETLRHCLVWTLEGNKGL